jgi:dienelactone hydrolase
MFFKNQGHIKGVHGKPIVYDICRLNNNKVLPVLIIAHGFKGYKDWGHFNLISESFAKEGFAVIKFNFSHNGGTLQQPIDFPDLEAFANNNFSIELDDLGCLIDEIEAGKVFKEYSLDHNHIYLLGHSRGGGIAVLKAKEDSRVNKVISWAGVASFERWDYEKVNEWKKNGVIYIMNGRTKQNMPLNYQLYDNYLANIERLDISRAISSMNIPHLIVHGSDDEAVPLDEGEKMKTWNPKAILEIIQNANHTFGGKHPWTEKDLPAQTKIAINKSVKFLK